MRTLVLRNTRTGLVRRMSAAEARTAVAGDPSGFEIVGTPTPPDVEPVADVAPDDDDG